MMRMCAWDDDFVCHTSNILQQVEPENLSIEPMADVCYKRSYVKNRLGEIAYNFISLV